MHAIYAQFFQPQRQSIWIMNFHEPNVNHEVYSADNFRSHKTLCLVLLSGVTRAQAATPDHKLRG